MKKTITMVAVALGLILAGAAHAEDAGKPESGPKMHHGEKHGNRFAKADKNSDGFLTKEEMTAAHQARMDKMFTRLDADKDGKLSKAEMEAGKKQMRAKMKERMEERKANKATEAPAESPAE